VQINTYINPVLYIYQLMQHGIRRNRHLVSTTCMLQPEDNCC